MNQCARGPRPRARRAYGRERWLDELAQELKSRTYQTTSRAAGVHTQTGRVQLAKLCDEQVRILPRKLVDLAE